MGIKVIEFGELNNSKVEGIDKIYGGNAGCMCYGRFFCQEDIRCGIECPWDGFTCGVDVEL